MIPDKQPTSIEITQRVETLLDEAMQEEDLEEIVEKLSLAIDINNTSDAQ